MVFTPTSYDVVNLANGAGKSPDTASIEAARQALIRQYQLPTANPAADNLPTPSPDVSPNLKVPVGEQTVVNVKPSVGTPPSSASAAGYSPTGVKAATPAQSIPAPTEGFSPPTSAEGIASTVASKGLAVSAGVSGVAATGISFISRLAAGQSLGQATVGAAATGTGTVIGTYAGAAAGAAIAGPIGAAVGGTLGGMAGGAIGSWVGDKLSPSSAEAQKANQGVNWSQVPTFYAPSGKSMVVHWRGLDTNLALPENKTTCLAYQVAPEPSGYYKYPYNLRIRFLLQFASGPAWNVDQGSGASIDTGSIWVEGADNPGDKPSDRTRNLPNTLPFAVPSSTPLNPGVSPQSPGASRTLAPATPAGTAHPDTRQNLGNNLPDPSGPPDRAQALAPTPITTAAPDGTHQSGQFASPGATPTGSPKTDLIPSTLPASSPGVAPKAVPFTPVTAPPASTPDSTNSDIQKQLDDITKMLAPLAIGTVLLQQLNDRMSNLENQMPSPENLAAAAAEGTCRTTQPGGCSAKLQEPTQQAAEGAKDSANAAKDSADAAKKASDAANNKLDELIASLEAAELSLLKIMNEKLGPQIEGGISSQFAKLFERFQAVMENINKVAKWLQLDRVLNILTWIQTLQNAYFLCDSLKVVTLQMISDGLAVIGISDKDGNPLNLNEIIGHEIEDLLKQVLGAENLEGMKKEWKALNRIYQAATNMMFALQNIMWSVLNALNVIGSWNAQIGNALKKYGVVGEFAFGWMNTAPNFHNKFFTAIFEAINVVSSLDMIAQSILQGRQAIDDIGKQKDEFDEALKDGTGAKPPENKPLADAAKKSAAESKSPAPNESDISKLQD